MSNKIFSIGFLSFFLLIISFTLSQCYYDSEEFLHPSLNSQCDTSNYTYSGAVLPILRENCYSCHSNSNSASFGGNVRLEGYENVKMQAENGNLFGAISHISGYAPMPKGGGKLDDCKISAIKKWIDVQMPNN